MSPYCTTGEVLSAHFVLTFPFSSFDDITDSSRADIIILRNVWQRGRPMYPTSSCFYGFVPIWGQNLGFVSNFERTVINGAPKIIVIALDN